MKIKLVSLLVFTLASTTSLANIGLIEESSQSRILFDNFIRHEVTTEDGIKLQLIELLGNDGKVMTSAEPELLVHGFTSNLNSWADLGPLEQANGKRVFIANWRGHGQGSNRSVGADGQDPNTDPRMVYDNLPAYDVPALLDYVYQTSGRKKVSWVGHSMGGMMMHLALAGVMRDQTGEMKVSKQRQKFLAARLSSFTAIGSPVSFKPATKLENLLFALKPTINGDRSDSILRILPGIRTLMKAARLDFYLKAQIVNPIRGLINFRSLSFDQYEALSEYASSRVPDPLVQSLNFGQRATGYSSEDGKIDYQKLSMGTDSGANKKPTVPTLIVSTKRDMLAPFDDQVKMVRNRELEHIIIEEAGHVDMVIGRNAPAIVNTTSRFHNASICRAIFSSASK